ncbi:MAG: radical SAM protein [Candidatus Odinarchaeota archaeon]
MSESIRVSVGTAATLDLLHCRLDALPTTAYTMISTENRCRANCAFCAQAQSSNAKANQLSRITWPNFSRSQIIYALEMTKQTGQFQRICIQTLYYPNLMEDLEQIVTEFIQHLSSIPISIALPPLELDYIQHLFNLGVDRVAISLDAATPKLFDTIKGTGVKGPFGWEQHNTALQNALSVFGAGRTTTHIIIGLGETDEQVITLFQELTDQGITIGLFPFTPISGTALAKQPRPSIQRYRRIQLAHFLIQNQLAHLNQLKFNSPQKQLVHIDLPIETLREVIECGTAFQTSGCPSCNRPFFTENPGGPLYNYPRPPNETELKEICNQLGGLY